QVGLAVVHVGDEGGDGFARICPDTLHLPVRALRRFGGAVERTGASQEVEVIALRENAEGLKEPNLNRPLPLPLALGPVVLLAVPAGLAAVIRERHFGSLRFFGGGFDREHAEEAGLPG